MAAPDPKFTMEVDPHIAAQQFQVEALRQITDNLKGLRAEMVEDRKVMSDVRERVIRIESNRLDREVQDFKKLVAAQFAELNVKVEKNCASIDMLQADKDRRDGALGVGAWFLKSPFVGWLAALAATVAAIVGWDRAA